MEWRSPQVHMLGEFAAGGDELSAGIAPRDEQLDDIEQKQPESASVRPKSCLRRAVAIQAWRPQPSTSPPAASATSSALKEPPVNEGTEGFGQEPVSQRQPECAGFIGRGEKCAVRAT